MLMQCTIKETTTSPTVNPTNDPTIYPSLEPTNTKALHTLSSTYFYMGDLDKAHESIRQAIQIKPTYANAYRTLSLILFAKGNTEDAQSSFKVAYDLDPKNSENGLVSFLLSINKKKSISGKIINPETQLAKSKLNFPITLRREVEPELLKSIYQFNTQNLNDMNDPTFGKARGSAYNLFEQNGEDLIKVKEDLMNLVKSSLDSDAFFKEGFFTILSGPSEVKKHYHLTQLDKHTDCGFGERKYALVYYLKTGDQDCEHPGALRFYEPDQEILPSEGMVVIFPADRYHSVIYGGQKDRVIIGINFYIN